MLMLQEYYSALASLVLAAARDRPELRQNIYEVARSRLRKQLDWQAQELNPAERGRRLQELEAAIEQLEADLAKTGPQHAHTGNNDLFYSVIDEGVEITPPDRRLPSNLAYKAQLESERQPRAILAVRSILLLVLAAILGFAAYAAVERTVSQADKVKQADENFSRNVDKPLAATELPLPTDYGTYALINSRLIELMPLPIKIPDHGNAATGLITSASRTKLPNGNMRFIVFNRDLVRDVPEKILVRIIARIIPHTSQTRKLRSPSDDTSTSWTVRNISYDMRVSPVKANRAMIVIRPANAKFVFPPGRYALVLKGVPYDFAVDGIITDLQQCLESDENANETTYTQCQHP
jgi:hypothetical protein